jgi:hypothetical protein
MRAGATGALESRGLLISSFEGRLGREPTDPADATKTGAPSRHPATALLIRGSKPDPRRVRTGAPNHQSQGRRGRALSSLSSSSPARGRPMCRIQEPMRAASRGIPLRESFRTLGPHRTGPSPAYQTRLSAFMDESPDHEPTLIERDMGVHLNQPDNSSTRNPQFATRSMGIVDASPLCPAEGRRMDV